MLLAVVMERDTMPISRHHRDFAIRKFHVITETFLSFVGTDTPQDVELLVQVIIWLFVHAEKTLYLSLALGPKTMKQPVCHTI